MDAGEGWSPKYNSLMHLKKSSNHSQCWKMQNSKSFEDFQKKKSEFCGKMCNVYYDNKQHFLSDLKYVEILPVIQFDCTHFATESK